MGDVTSVIYLQPLKIVGPDEPQCPPMKNPSLTITGPDKLFHKVDEFTVLA